MITNTYKFDIVTNSNDNVEGNVNKVTTSSRSSDKGALSQETPVFSRLAHPHGLQVTANSVTTSRVTRRASRGVIIKESY